MTIMLRPLSLVLATTITLGGWAALSRWDRGPRAVAPLAAPRAAPAWKNSSWLNAERPLTLESLRGRVVLLNFWVFTCYNCTNTVPSLVDFDRKYRSTGLTLIGIHTPEFPPSAGEHDTEFHQSDAEYQRWSRRIEELVAE